MDYLYIIIIGLIVLAIAKFLLKFTIKRIIPLILNIVLGIVVLWIVNPFGAGLGIAIPVNIITALIVGLGGVPGVILLIILCFVGII